MRHRRLPRLDLEHSSYFLTNCLDRRRPLLRQAELAQYLIALYSRLRDQGGVALHGYVIMPDHYHVLLTLKTVPSISQVVRAVHSSFAIRLHQVSQVRGRTWQRRFRDHVLRDEEDYRTKISYMHANPVRAGLVENPVDYTWSSCRYWEAGEGPVSCDPLG